MSLPSRLLLRALARRGDPPCVLSSRLPKSAFTAMGSMCRLTTRALHSAGETSPVPSSQVLPRTRLARGSDCTTVFTKAVLNGLRDLQSLHNLAPDPDTTSPPDYTAALRAVSLLAGCDGGRGKPMLSLSELEQAVPSETFPVAWKVIRTLLADEPLPELEALDDKGRAMVLFNRVHGFGKVRATAFAETGIRTLDELASTKEGKWTISDAQMLAIKYHEEMEIMVPRSEVDEFRVLIGQALSKADPTFCFAIMGSYRRGEEISSDVDVVIWHPSFTKRDKEEKRSKKSSWKEDSLMAAVVTALNNSSLLEESKIFTKGDKKVLALTRLPSPNSIHRQIDIRICPLESLPYMLLGNTGDGMLMKIVRGRAARKGWVLNEYGMGKRSRLSKAAVLAVIEEGTEIIVQSEQEIFELLGLPYLEPHQRGAATYRRILAGH